MKQLLLFVTVLGFSVFSYSQEETENPKAPVIEFENITHNFGTIAQNSEAICVFKFTNAGKEPLVIENVRSSCGCTVPEWSKEPIKKKDSGEIVVQYNTNVATSFSKSITVYSNAKNNPVRLTITGIVEPLQENAKSKAGIQKIPMEQLPKK